MRGVVSLAAEACAGVDFLHSGRSQPKETEMADLHALRDGLVVTAFWQAKPGEVDSLVEIIREFLPQAQREPGVQAFQIHQSLSEPENFFFYEVFRDEAAFAAHQQSEHFKTLIAGQAVPKLAKRERTQHRFV
jgi:quinol monooxygenase YgiN